MKIVRLTLCLLTVVIAVGMLSACNRTSVDTELEVVDESAEPDIPIAPTNDSKANSSTTPDKITRASKVEKTAVQAQAPRYVHIDEAGTYNTEIITAEMLSSCKLPHLDKAALPYWTGLILEDKISVNYSDDRWSDYTGGWGYWNEQEIRYMAENGFNCVRACYSLSFLSNPEDPNMIDEAELEQLDELISWCMKYNMHLIISQTGLPGRYSPNALAGKNDFDYWNNYENAGGNIDFFLDKEIQELNYRYFEMLSRRYADIPNGVFSFELCVENMAPEGDSQLQADVLGPVAEVIWSYTPDRIVIVNDIGRKEPDKLAELGCCISLHTHFYSIDGAYLKDTFGVDYEPHWPIQYLPGFTGDNRNPLVLKSEDAFKEGKLRIYVEYKNDFPRVSIDGKTVMDNSYDFKNTTYEPEIISVDIPEGSKTVEIDFVCEISFCALEIEQAEKSKVLVTHSLYNNYFYSVTPEDIERMPVLQVNDDLSITDISEDPVMLDGDYVERVFLQRMIDTARTNGVSFIMTEVGTDQAAVLTPEEYLEYERCFLDPLRKNGIGWMYNSVHNILAPKEIMWLNGDNTKFADFSEVPDMYGYSVNNTVMDFLKAYTK